MLLSTPVNLNDFLSDVLPSQIYRKNVIEELKSCDFLKLDFLYFFSHVNTVPVFNKG